MSARLFVVRHGESTWNAVRRWQGQANPPLSELGEAEAHRAGLALGTLGDIELVVTSTLERARRTGELLATSAGVTFGDAYAGLAERGAGAWEGLTRDEIEARDPGFLASGRRPTGYEPDDALVVRALDALAEVAALAASTVVVVTHGGVIHALERHVNGDDGTWQRLDNLEGRWFIHDGAALHIDGPRRRLIERGVTSTTDPAEI